MGHAIHRVEHFEIVGPYTLTLRFADGSQQRIDFRPVLEGEVFGPLQDLQIFKGSASRHFRATCAAVGIARPHPKADQPFGQDMDFILQA